MKSKAYCFANASDYDADDISETVTFAETPGKAKQNIRQMLLHSSQLRSRAAWSRLAAKFRLTRRFRFKEGSYEC